MRRRPPDRFPHAVEEQLASRLQRRARAVRSLILDQLRAIQRKARADSVFGGASLGPRIRLAVVQAKPVTPASLTSTGKAVDTAVARGVGADLGESTAGVEPNKGAVQDWARETATRIAEAEAAQVDTALAAADEAANAGEDPVKAAASALDSAETRAALLARDAVGNLTAAVAMACARQMGSERFVWRTRRDERVRDRHQELEGTEWRWDAPPEDEGLPGTPPHCRCWGQALPPGK